MKKLTFYLEHAVEYGLKEAILIQFIKDRIESHPVFVGHRKGTHLCLSELEFLLRFMDMSMCCRIKQRLIRQGVIEKICSSTSRREGIYSFTKEFKMM